VTRIEVLTETDEPNGWVFGVHVRDLDGSSTAHEVHLHWSDYDHWSGGASRPERVVEAVIRFLLSHISKEEIRPRFDASIVRRMYDDADDEISRQLP
jgi:hypothetical protein